jgi:hypothetical protein
MSGRGKVRVSEEEWAVEENINVFANFVSGARNEWSRSEPRGPLSGDEQDERPRLARHLPIVDSPRRLHGGATIIPLDSHVWCSFFHISFTFNV